MYRLFSAYAVCIAMKPWSILTAAHWMEVFTNTDGIMRSLPNGKNTWLPSTDARSHRIANVEVSKKKDRWSGAKGCNQLAKFCCALLDETKNPFIQYYLNCKERITMITTEAQSLAVHYRNFLIIRTNMSEHTVQTNQDLHCLLYHLCLLDALLHCKSKSFQLQDCCDSYVPSFIKCTVP